MIYKSLIKAFQKADTDNFNNSVSCPICGMEQCHVLSVGLVEGTDGYEAKKVMQIEDLDNFQLKELSFQTPNRVRKLDISIRFGCEAGDFFYKTYSFHKGNTFITLTPDNTIQA